MSNIQYLLWSLGIIFLTTVINLSMGGSHVPSRGWSSGSSGGSWSSGGGSWSSGGGHK